MDDGIRADLRDTPAEGGVCDACGAAAWLFWGECARCALGRMGAVRWGTFWRDGDAATLDTDKDLEERIPDGEYVLYAVQADLVTPPTDEAP